LVVNLAPSSLSISKTGCHVVLHSFLENVMRSQSLAPTQWEVTK
jgi:hypothetical protein